MPTSIRARPLARRPGIYRCSRRTSGRLKSVAFSRHLHESFELPTLQCTSPHHSVPTTENSLQKHGIILLSLRCPRSHLAPVEPDFVRFSRGVAWCRALRGSTIGRRAPSLSSYYVPMLYSSIAVLSYVIMLLQVNSAVASLLRSVSPDA